MQQPVKKGYDKKSEAHNLHRGTNSNVRSMNFLNTEPLAISNNQQLGDGN